ncbi:MAG TPA: endolytic transglycosylase MltG [Anaerolineaceae bacterium]|uniref:Endolytic murein transglycosylase n=1 Tax=Anaerolinea thermophila TaxID=167964 RepID=A0A101FZ97_9CHLR|nr:MAG: hypothetical protein XD73_0060 [Anaerolinea thermophila]HAF61088.1 endolytic transglycosylase MltG [Anaerolineaceae bacterium]
MKKKHTGLVVVLLGIVLLGVILCAFFLWIPRLTVDLFGQPDFSLSVLQTDKYALNLYLHHKELTRPMDSNLQESQEFDIVIGDSAMQVSQNLANAGLIPDETAFLTYLIYKGYDRTLQSGTYIFSRAQTPVEMAATMIDPTPLDVTFAVLPGMRFEEIAGLIATSGLNFTAEDLMRIYETKEGIMLPAIFQNVPNLEGLILAGEYEILRSSTVIEFVQYMIDQTAAQFTPEVLNAFAEQGLDAYQAVTLASIVEREAVRAEEKNMIAAVFLNRLKIGMPLQSDPTVQYAIAQQEGAAGWWKVPLTSTDLQVDSLYNTYIYNGLPPTPICAVNVDSLIAIAMPLQSDFYYFRSACDGSGYHVFARDYAEHQSNACP